MRIHFFGHAACAITASSGASLLIDPYLPGAFDGRFKYPRIVGDFVATTCTHDHIDHNATHLIDAPRIDAGEVGPFAISRFALSHDEFGGTKRGGSSDSLIVRVDGMSVVHLGDCGQSPEGHTPLHHCDVLLVPVGGYFTIGAFQAVEWWKRLQPRVCIPIHYRTPQCDLPIRGLETFLALVREYNRANASYIDVEVDSQLPRVVVLEPGPSQKTGGLAP